MIPQLPVNILKYAQSNICIISDETRFCPIKLACSYNSMRALFTQHSVSLRNHQKYEGYYSYASVTLQTEGSGTLLGDAELALLQDSLGLFVT